jgi:DNA (cytosine-5)-methyltransferase 1
VSDVALRTLSLCAGYGGLDLGLRLAGVPIQLVAAVERQAYAAAILASRMVEGALDPCPVWDDLESFDGRAWRGCVDLVTAGFPCQGASVAGKRRGTEDGRWLWPRVWQIVSDCEASMLFVENVPGLLTVNAGRAFRSILDAISARGWIAEWDCVSAGSVGAPHLRDRVFLLAADPDGIELRQLAERDQRQGRRERAAERGNAKPTHDGGARDAADATGIGQQAGNHRHGRARQGRIARHDANRCDVSPGWARVIGRAAPLASFRRVDDGASAELEQDWHERLHLLGNGVVPRAAARAWQVLYGRLSAP